MGDADDNFNCDDDGDDDDVGDDAEVCDHTAVCDVSKDDASLAPVKSPGFLDA